MRRASSTRTPNRVQRCRPPSSCSMSCEARESPIRRRPCAPHWREHRIMRPILALLGAVVLLASGCETTKEIVTPTVAQLEQFKNLAAQGRYEEIEPSNVDCKAPQPGCAHLHWIQADACYR